MRFEDKSILKMKRVLLDTNIYGRILEKGAEKLIREAIETDKLKNKFIIYGNDLIRAELRKTSQRLKIREANLRVALLTIFDILVQQHRFEINRDMEWLAQQYFKVYKEIGGSQSEKVVINDFTIVASAALRNLDIIYSDDSKTIVNEIKRLRTPNFESYSSFINEIRRLLL